MVTAESKPANSSGWAKLVHFFCRVTFFNTLLGFTFPIALCFRSSYARYVQALVRYVLVPIFLYVHIMLLPRLQDMESGLMIWHGLFAYWITIPMGVFGGALVRGCREPMPFLKYFAAAFTVYCWHKYIIPAIQPTIVGSILVQVFLIFFQDLCVLAWLWCLHHVVQVQDLMKVRPELTECPIKKPSNPEDRVLIIGNAPNVMEGRTLGPVIDGFEQVCRFNTYTVDHPEYTGTKVTYHFANGRNIPQSPHVQAVAPIFNASLTHAAYLFFPDLANATNTMNHVLSDKTRVWFVEEDRLLKLCKKLRLPFFQIPSSGMVAIDAMMSRYDKVYIHGFSFFQGKRLHYFDEPVLQLVTSWLERFITHNAPCEKTWVEGLVAEQTVLLLPNHVVEVPGGENISSPKSKERGEKKPNLFRLIEEAFPSQFSM